MCCVCSAVVYWLLYPSGRSSAETLLACFEQFGSWPECGEFQLGVLWSACEVRPDASPTRTEALQSSLVRRGGVGSVGRGLC